MVLSRTRTHTARREDEEEGVTANAPLSRWSPGEPPPWLVASPAASAAAASRARWNSYTCWPVAPLPTAPSRQLSRYA
jgi:hypothetical protein